MNRVIPPQNPLIMVHLPDGAANRRALEVFKDAGVLLLGNSLSAGMQWQSTSMGNLVGEFCSMLLVKSPARYDYMLTASKNP